MTLQRKTPTLTRCWSLKGQQPQIPLELGHHEKQHLFGAVCPTTGGVHIRKACTINAQKFTLFLKQLSKRYPGRPIVFIVDNAVWHRARTVKARIPRGLRLFFLTPYSPDLNPIERLWKRLRKDVTHNAFFPSMKHLHHALKRFFAYLKKHPDEVISLC